VKIIVISLAKSQDRRAKVVEKLGSKNIEFEFLDAVDGCTDNHPYLKNHNPQSFLIHCRRKALPGELGCSASHFLAWEKSVDLDEPLAVLEDDFSITDDFVEGLNFTAPYLDRVGFVRLEKLESNFYFDTPYKNEKFALVKQIKVAKCMTGYIITPHGAKALLAKGREIRTPIDLYLRYTLIHKQLIYALTPTIVRSSDATSIIGFEVKDLREKGFILRIKHFFRRWAYAISSLAVNIANACIP
jgi:glycosyl transferase, family 25